MRTTITIILGLIGIAVISGLVYFGWDFVRDLLFSPEEAPAESEEEKTQPAALSLVFKNPAINYWNGYYVDFNGNIIKTGGAEEEIIGKVNASPIISVLPSPNGLEIIVAFGNPQNPQFSIFNASTTEWHPLGPKVKAVAWSPNNSRFATIENSSIVINENGRKKKLMDVNVLDAGLKWVKENIILLTEKPSASLINSLWIVDIKNKTLRLSAAGSGLMLKPGQNETLVFSTTRNFPTLELKTYDGSQLIESLPFLTLPDKCAINGLELYCAIPIDGLGTTVPDDYLKKRFYSNDAIYKYNLEEKKLSIILQAQTDNVIDAVNLKIIGNELFFINRYDNYVYSIELE